MKSMKSKVWVIALGFLVALSPLESYAGGKIDIDEDTFITLGAGLRSSFSAIEDGADDGKSTSHDFILDSFRLYIGGQFNDVIKFEFNADREEDSTGDEDLRVLDGVVKFEFDDLFNIWTGRFLPPSDRSNLSGPYYLNSWTFPIAQRYPAIFAGRDDGIAFWGQVDGGKMKYQVGAFEGVEGPNGGDQLLYTGRFTVNLLDPEPGYYNSSTYYGAKEILAIGIVGYHQTNAAGTVAGSEGDFNGWNIDTLYETKLSNEGVLSLEGAFYDYDSDDMAGTTAQGDGGFALVSYLCPDKVGPEKHQGQLQPYFRVQTYDNDFGAGSGETDQYDIGLNYIIDGHNARVTLQVSDTDPETGSNFHSVFLGLQLQI
jgi:hypothetical protein